MALGYDGKLYILAFDHRGSFQTKMFGIEGDPTPEETEKISDAKKLIFEGMVKAVERGVDPEATGVLVDEQFGSDIPKLAKEHGLKLSMPAEKNERQLDRLKRLADWLHAHDRRFLFELLVPAEPGQLESVDGDSGRYDAELRPELMRRAIEQVQDHGIEVDVWKIEGVDAREDAQMLITQTRKGEGREGVTSVVLGRGASDEKVDHWLRQAAPVEGFVGFAIGRSIWWDELKGFLDGDLERDAASDQIAENYLRFVKVYNSAEQAAHV
jgi:myo-inositol catabolism protein IolC